MTPSDQSVCVDCGDRPVDPKYPRIQLCDRCYQRRWRARTGYVSTEATRRFRSDPEKRERDREFSRRWKREHLGQPGEPKR